MPKRPKATKTSTRAKKATTEARSGPVVVTRVKLRDQLHPAIFASALDLADGDARRIEVLTPTSVMVTM